MFSYFSPKIKGYEVLIFDNVELTTTKPSNAKPILIQSGPLKVLFFEDKARFVLTLNRWKYALTKCLPIMASYDNANNLYSYIVPAFEGSFTLTLSKVQHPESVINFETILKSTGKFSYENESMLEASSFNISANDVSISTTNTSGTSRGRQSLTNSLWKNLAKASVGFIGGASKENSNPNMVQVKSLPELKLVKDANLQVVTFNKEEVDEAVGRSIENFNRISKYMKNEALTYQAYNPNFPEGSEQKDTFEDLLMDISEMPSFKDDLEDELNIKMSLFRKLTEEFEKERTEFLEHEKELMSLREGRLEKIKEMEENLEKDKGLAHERQNGLLELINKQDKMIIQLQETIKEMLGSFKLKDAKLKEIENDVIACKKEFMDREQELKKSVRVHKAQISEKKIRNVDKRKDIDILEEELIRATRMVMTTEAMLESKKEQIQAEKERLYANLKKREEWVVREKNDIEKLEQDIRSRIDNKVQALWDKRIQKNDFKELDNKLQQMRETLKTKKSEKRELLERGERKAREELERRAAEAQKELNRIKEKRVEIENDYHKKMDEIKEKKLHFSRFRDYIDKECEVEREKSLDRIQKEVIVTEESIYNFNEQEYDKEADNDVLKKLQSIKQLEAELQAENSEMMREHLLLQQELEELMRDYGMSSDEDGLEFDNREGVLVEC